MVMRVSNQLRRLDPSTWRLHDAQPRPRQRPPARQRIRSTNQFSADHIRLAQRQLASISANPPAPAFITTPRRPATGLQTKNCGVSLSVRNSQPPNPHLRSKMCCPAPCVDSHRLRVDSVLRQQKTTSSTLLSRVHRFCAVRSACPPQNELHHALVPPGASSRLHIPLRRTRSRARNDRHIHRRLHLTATWLLC